MQTNDNFFSTISRLRWIQRWSLQRNTLSENVIEHSWETAVIAYLLGVINNEVCGGDIEAERLCTMAMFHDSAEAITGDLPTPVKYYSQAIQQAYKVIEQDAEKSLVKLLPAALQDRVRPMIDGHDLSFHERKLLKAADSISAYLKAKAELANGNSDYALAEQQIKQRLKDYALDEVEYFWQHFVEPQTDTRKRSAWCNLSPLSSSSHP